MKSFDLILFVLLVAIALTVALFSLDVFPYPFGIIILSAFALGRWLSLKGPKQN